jgi:hypothetical protein
MGAWGPGPFENDAALDWVILLKKSEDGAFPLGVLRRLDAGDRIGVREQEEGIAAAEAVAASRGWPAESLPAGLENWLARTGGAADTAAAQLALQVIGKIEGDNSELGSLWDEVDGTPWRESLADLRERLEASPREVVSVPPPAEVPIRVGDVAQLLTSTGKISYIQLIGQDQRGLDLIRVMPGLFSVPLWGESLAAFVGGETAFLSLGLFRGMLALDGARASGNYLVPPVCAGPQPLKSRSGESPDPGRGPVTHQGQRLSAEEFARLHPDIDQTMLTDWATIPFPGSLLRMIECDWRPWMGGDKAWMYPEDSDQPSAAPPRPAPYPPTARPGKFLLGG